MARQPLLESDVVTVASVLRRRVGWSWPITLAKALVGTRYLVLQSRWASERSEEAAFVRRLALAPALYLELKARLGAEGALRVVREILVPLGVREVNRTIQSIPDLPSDAMSRLCAFYETANQLPPNKFIPRTTVERNDQRYHVRLTGCIFHEFFSAVGTPELTPFICTVDEEFFPSAFPELTFDRDGAWTHAIGRGNPTCEFVFVRTEPKIVDKAPSEQAAAVR